MATSYDVMNYIKTQFNLTGEVQLQKLLYYAQAWHLVWEGKPLFSEPIEAWRMGPVVKSLRYCLSFPPGTYTLTSSERASIDAVIEHYGRHYGWVLSGMTHQELPWVITRGNLPANADSNQPIDPNVMRSYYTEQSMKGEGPRRVAATTEASDDEVLAVARRNRERWQGTLEILAQ
jgi:uncharacterized phage-associated protein